MRLPESLRLRLCAWARKKMQMPPDFIIRPHGHAQTLRWWIIPRNRWLNVYLHRWVASDEDRALHDHPWRFNLSIIIEGSCIEHDLKGLWQRQQGYIYFRFGASPHRIQLWRKGSMMYDAIRKPITPTDESDPVTTLFITGPKFREWGFLCPKGWRHWKEFCDDRDQGLIGKGCE